MSARPSSSLGFNRNASAVSFPSSTSSEQARRRADSSGVVPSGTALAAELYASLFPLDSLDNQDLSIPPPPYELIDPISPAITHHNPHQPNATPASQQTHRSSDSPDAQSASASRSALSRSTPPSASTSRSGVPRNTQSAPTSSRRISPAGQAKDKSGSRNVDAAHQNNHRRAPRGPRPPLNHRSRSEHALKTTAGLLGDHVPYSGGRSHAHPLSPTGEQSAKHPLRTPKLPGRPPLPSIVDPDKLYQPIIYQPFSPPPTPVSSRPPLSNASRQNRSRHQSFGLQRSNHIRASLITGSVPVPSATPSINSPPTTNSTTAMMMTMGQAGRLRKRASDSFHAEPVWAGRRPFLLDHPVGRPAPLSTAPKSLPPTDPRLPSPSFQKTSRLVCPECQFAFYDLHFMNLHRSLVHDSRLNFSTTSSSSSTNNNNNDVHHENEGVMARFPWPPPPNRPPPPLPLSIDRSLLIQAARNIYQSNYFT
ncbi:hypothetical protein PGT21_020412 [Puccinia graminis f. sp. tritici]|uniref:C2H2-type domain-containing protein n=1 Tax=Puccinia graminis f. sp. tritici TaxID=56615 RepID=A0A5B0MMM5_PUCGR|nr:hypothetical protein PGT21_020412 [Puccinia graminis f. sp. tritici]